jgi:hypothetical protein
MEMNGQLEYSGCLGNISITYWMLGCVDPIANLYELYIHVTVHRNRFLFK